MSRSEPDRPARGRTDWGMVELRNGDGDRTRHLHEAMAHGMHRGSVLWPGCGVCGSGRVGAAGRLDVCRHAARPRAHPRGHRQQLPALPVPRWQWQGAGLRSRHVAAVPAAHRHPGGAGADGLGPGAEGVAGRQGRRDRHALPHTGARAAVRVLRAVRRAGRGHLRGAQHPRHHRQRRPARLSRGGGARRRLRRTHAKARHHRLARIHQLQGDHPGCGRRQHRRLLHGHQPGQLLPLPLRGAGQVLPRLHPLHRPAPPRRARGQRRDAADGGTRHGDDHAGRARRPA